MMHRKAVGLLPLLSLLLVASGCEPDPLAAPPGGLTRIAITIDPPGKAERYVTEDSREGRFSGTDVPMACSGVHTYSEMCALDYCNAPGAQPPYQPACAAPKSPDGKYRYRFVAHVPAGETFVGWDVTTEAGTVTPLLTSDRTQPNLDVWWDATSIAQSASRNYQLVARFKPASQPPPSPPESLGACDGAVTDLGDANGARGGEVVVACGSVVLAKRDGSGSQRLATAQSKVVASDGAYAYYDSGAQVYRVPLAGGAATAVTKKPAPGPIAWIGVDDAHVYYLAEGVAGRTLYSAFKDGTAYPDTRSEVVYGETRVFAADVDGTSVFFAYADGSGAATVARVPKGSDLSAVPTTIATGVTPPAARMRHTATLLTWGSVTLAQAGGAPRTVGAFAARDGIATATKLYVLEAGCVRAIDLAPGAAPSTIACGAVAPVGLSVDDARVYWTQGGKLLSAPK